MVRPERIGPYKERGPVVASGNYCECLRCGGELGEGSMPRDLCRGCQLDLIRINNRLIEEYNKNNNEQNQEAAINT